MTIDPQIEERIDTVEVDIHHTTLPVGRHSEGAAIGPHLVGVFVDRPLRVTGLSHHAPLPVVHSHLMLEDDLLIHVDGHAVAEKPLSSSPRGGEGCVSA